MFGTWVLKTLPISPHGQLSPFLVLVVFRRGVWVEGALLTRLAVVVWTQASTHFWCRMWAEPILFAMRKNQGLPAVRHSVERHLYEL